MAFRPEYVEQGEQREQQEEGVQEEQEEREEVERVVKKNTSRQYCTQECLQGLLTRGALDKNCPNVEEHRGKAKDQDKHVVSASTFLRLMSSPPCSTTVTFLRRIEIIINSSQFETMALGRALYVSYRPLF